ncbi:MAG: heme-binding protein [Planctomycetes bacterium]|nr:heme-binding protein [Planctomycetota bacterium]MBI3846179.1 heme-binding protein [Planctomycetota bacterium]
MRMERVSGSIGLRAAAGVALAFGIGFCGGLWIVGCQGKTSSGVGEEIAVPTTVVYLSQADVEAIITQAVTQAETLRVPVVIAVTDRDGNVLGAFRTIDYRVEDDRAFPLPPPDPSCLAASCVPDGSGLPFPLTDFCMARTADAISKAGTASYFQSNAEAFTTRTALAIVQDHFPADIRGTPGGPLYGVQFSSVVGTDINPIARDAMNQPVGGSITGFLGGVPLFKELNPVGGVGVVGFSCDPNDVERIALAGQAGFEPQFAIQADRILIDGIRFPYVDSAPVEDGPTMDFATIDGMRGVVEPCFPLRDSPGHRAYPTRTLGGVTGEVYCDFAGQLVDPNDANNCIFRDSLDPDPNDPNVPADLRAAAIRVADVERIIAGSAERANHTRAAIRRPIGTSAAVFITVVDRGGNILGIFRTPDATLFSLDVAVQKGRTCAFFSDDQAAFTSRAIGFMSQGIFPPGIDGAAEGPLFFLQTCATIACADTFDPNGMPLQGCRCVPANWPLSCGAPPQSCMPAVLPCGLDQFSTLLNPLQRPIHLTLDDGSKRNLQNSFTIFPGGVPLYRNGHLVGAVGISGDGVDQDDIISDSGATGGDMQAPRTVRCDFLPEAAIVDRLGRVLAALQNAPSVTDPSSAMDPNAIDPGVQAQATMAIQRLQDRGIQNLRLPWVKFPRHPDT